MHTSERVVATMTIQRENRWLLQGPWDRHRDRHLDKVPASAQFRYYSPLFAGVGSVNGDRDN